MAKRILILVVIFLGCSTFTSLNESRATDEPNTSSASDNKTNSRVGKYKPPYRIINSRYVSRSTIKKNIGNINNGVRIRILQNGIDNADIEDLSIAYDSGNEYHMGSLYGVENARLPLYVKVTYRSWNTFHAVQFDVTYEFMILSKGTWDVTIWN